MKTYKILFLFLFISTFTFAQNAKRDFKSANFEQENQFKIEVSDGVYFINFCNSKIVETTFYPKGEVKKDESHAVVLKPTSTHIKIDKNNNEIIYKSDGISVKIQKSPFQILYYYKDKLVTSEKQGYFKSKHIPMDLVKGNIVADETEKIEFNLTEDEVLI